MASNTVLKASDLNKSFSGIIAAKDINVSIDQGEIVGIIGANGAGKTVFVNMITGYLKPTSGSIEFLGKESLKKIKNKGITRKLMGVKIDTNELSLSNNELLDINNQVVGELRSAAFSPKIDKIVGISMMRKEFCKISSKDLEEIFKVNFFSIFKIMHEFL